jgi:hypothetical protein
MDRATFWAIFSQTHLVTLHASCELGKDLKIGFYRFRSVAVEKLLRLIPGVMLQLVEAFRNLPS